MFCNQCEQTARGIACKTVGVCGKDPITDVLQDLLLYLTASLAKVSLWGEEKGIKNEKVDSFIVEAIFSTLTNVNFDPERFIQYITEAITLREKLKNSAGYREISPLTEFIPKEDRESLIEQAKELEITPEKFNEGEDIVSLKFTILYGLKGISAYTYHAVKLGIKNPEILRGIKSLLVKIFEDKNTDLTYWINLALETGRLNLVAMEALDKANTEAFGHPEPTKVSLGIKKGKAILVSGHDLKDLYDLLVQTEGKGINIYTHGEMLPAHGYPEIKKFKHLVGHFGTAWQNQQKELPEFPGPVLFTTNCLMPPKESYREKIFTIGPVGYPGIKHIKNNDFTPMIEMALKMEGYKEDVPGKEIYTGFAHNTLLSVAEKIVKLIKSGKVKHIFLVGGCDGAKPARNYYTKLVELTPDDTLILTLGCGKFKFFDKDLGFINDIPRLLDCGQCNDAYSAIKLAVALSKILQTEIEQLPLSIVLSWYEQKAVAILLTLLYLGIKNIKIGPSLPAFFSKNIVELLTTKYNLNLIKDPETDLKEILGT